MLHVAHCNYISVSYILSLRYSDLFVKKSCNFIPLLYLRSMLGVTPSKFRKVIRSLKTNDGDRD